MLGRPSRSAVSRRPQLTRLGVLTSGLGTLLLLTACQTSDQTSTAGVSGAAATNGSPSAGARVNLEDYHIIPPTAGREIGYRFDWQAEARPDRGTGMRQVVRRGGAVLALDGGNFLTRFRDDDGDRVWRTPVAQRVADVRGLNHVDNPDRVFVTTETDVYELDGGTGAVLNRAVLGKIANTAPVELPPYLIYGGRNGQLIWHAYGIGDEALAYQVGRTITAAPVLTNGGVFVVSADGQARMLTYSSAQSIWWKDLRSRVVAPPATDGNAVYIADLGQTLWAIDAGNGRTLWRRLMPSPLSEAPVYAGGRVYQAVPGEGLVALEALPRNTPDGRIVWTSDAVGQVIGSSSAGLLVWDGRDRAMHILDDRSGDIMKSIDLPQVSHIMIDRDRTLVAYSDDGRVLRMSPRR